LVPRWHPIYHDSYTIERLRGPVERLVRPRGLWESLQAVARLAHHGCRAGTLRVPPFNGRLFSPAHAPLADGVALDDRAVREALLALTTCPGANARERISYADLGVEQLGGVYERLLDFAPARVEGRTPALVRAERRRTTGSFYTPRSLTEFVVRRTLAPLVADATAERILSLRVLDPAMGSGAFLVAACRYLASAYESALVHEGLSPADITPADRAAFRRTVAQRCLFGVDINPTAVQLARLSLWLATLAADRPLTFLDHHLRTGNSLAGTSLDAVMRRRPGRARSARRDADLPLFSSDTLTGALRAASTVRVAIAEEPGDSIEQVRSKEHALATLRVDGELVRWIAVADLWCAVWFDDVRGAALQKAFGALADRLLRRDMSLAAHVAEPLLERARDIAAREQFFHWPLEFPEVFEAPPDGTAGFDAVIGNPPWEMLRGDRGSAEDRAAARLAGSRLTAFARTSGSFLLQGDGHTNLFQLFVERALRLVRNGGRVGLVLPWGFASDHGCAPLRRQVLDRTSIDTFVSIDNRDAVFPIHRSVRILLMTTTTGGGTPALPCRLGLRSPEDLDACADTGAPELSVNVPRPLIDRFSGPSAGIPDIRSTADLETVAAIVRSVPALGDAAGWNVH
ncbi:MAG TPA: N-6 DNA methylase, partial [Vicinamibacterales bacterium]|nr:N-6 DNA methylase [Vicinamibacterales bacterium]